MTKTQDLKKILIEQIELLTDWNKKNIESNPEQVRQNVETLSHCFLKLVDFLE